MTEHGSFVIVSNCLKYDPVPVHLFQSKLCGFLYGKLKILTKIIIFLIVLLRSLKPGKISSTSAVMKMILVWMLSGTSLQCHMGNMHVMGLAERLKDEQESKVCKTLMQSRSRCQENFTSGLL
jgi:hypothetical protein